MSSSPEMIIDENGNKHWYLNGNLHREDGPAIERGNGDKLWLINSRLHREDGPAVEKENGERLWYLNGDRIKYDPETWDQIVKESKIENIMNY